MNTHRDRDAGGLRPECAGTSGGKALPADGVENGLQPGRLEIGRIVGVVQPANVLDDEPTFRLVTKGQVGPSGGGPQHRQAVADHAAVATAVSAVVELGKPWAKGVVNAVLRQLQRRHQELVAGLEPAAAAAGFDSVQK